MIGCDSSTTEEGNEWIFRYHIHPRMAGSLEGIEIPGNRNGETLTASIFHRGITVASETRTIINNAVQISFRWYMNPWESNVSFDGIYAMDFFIGIRIGDDSQLLAPIVMIRAPTFITNPPYTVDGWFDPATQLYLFGD